VSSGASLAAWAGLLMPSLSWSAVMASGANVAPAPARRPLVVQPIFTYPIATRQQQSSWRNWGGIETEADANEELARIEGEIKSLKSQADFPIEFRPTAKVRGLAQLGAIPSLATADAILFYSAGDGGPDGLMSEVNAVDKLGKDTIFFVRHQNGPLPPPACG
jgi:hypothetical protein